MMPPPIAVSTSSATDGIRGVPVTPTDNSVLDSASQDSSSDSYSLKIPAVFSESPTTFFELQFLVRHFLALILFPVVSSKIYEVILMGSRWLVKKTKSYNMKLNFLNRRRLVAALRRFTRCVNGILLRIGERRRWFSGLDDEQESNCRARYRRDYSNNLKKNL